MNKGHYSLDTKEKRILNPEGALWFGCDELTGYQQCVVLVLIEELNRLWDIINENKV
jgi:hypothetical protein